MLQGTPSLALTIHLFFNRIFLSVFASEARVPFFKGYASVLSGKRLYQELQTFNATAEVKVALEKICGCYRGKIKKHISGTPN